MSTYDFGCKMFQDSNIVHDGSIDPIRHVKLSILSVYILDIESISHRRYVTEGAS